LDTFGIGSDGVAASHETPTPCAGATTTTATASTAAATDDNSL
jgi:hypothetical protein